jgi:putative membrane protein
MRSIRFAAFVLVAAAAVSAFKRPAPLNDAAIAGILVAADSWDSTTGTLASKKASRADVRAYGATLARDHAGVNVQAVALAKKLGVTPTPVPADFPLKLDFEATMKKLNGLSGPAFDDAFLEHEVSYHKAVIDAVTTQFLPAIQNAELKQFVQSIAPAFQAHLALAENLQKKGM